MKKIAVLTLCLSLLFALAACGSAKNAAAPSSSNAAPASASKAPEASTSSPSASAPAETAKANESAEPSEKPEDAASGKLGDYSVTIVSCETTEDLDGKPAILVTYEWTNNSKEAANFMLSLYSKAVQNGVECEPATIDDENFDGESLLTDIEPGASATVQEAYSLQDTKSDITISVTELVNLDDNPPVVSEIYTFES